MKKNKRILGSLYEELAAAYLKDQGLEIIRKNYRVKSGEIDLIALDGEYLVFVEVKYRSSGCAGDSLCAVDAAKQRAKNYRVKSGEIDLIALDGEYLVFVEVKYRSSGCAGDSLCAVDAAKQRAISHTAMHYLVSQRDNVNLPCRFDVVGIDRDEIHWIKNAFDYCG